MSRAQNPWDTFLAKQGEIAACFGVMVPPAGVTLTEKTAAKSTAMCPAMGAGMAYVNQWVATRVSRRKRM